MSHAWILLVALPFVASCSREDGSRNAPRGEVVYSSVGCTMCHGGSGEGSALAPPLAGSKARWERAALLEYLKNPTEYAAKDPRLAEQKKKYSIPMPSYASQPPADLEALADFVLSR
jgi:cytochrome c2